MSGIKQIFLDLDGPLLDGKERHYHCYRSILERFGFKPVGIDEYWEKKRTMVNRRDLLKLSGAEEIYDDYLASWLAMIETPEMLALDKVQEGAIRILRSWKQREIELILVTMRKNRLALEAQLIATGLRQQLDAVLVCDHAEGGEGKAEAVQNMYPSKRFEKQTLWIGDTEADWEAAKTLGCAVALLSNGLRNEEYLKSLVGGQVMATIASVNDMMLENQNDS